MNQVLSANQRKRIDDAHRAHQHMNYWLVATGRAPNAAALKGLQPSTARVLTDADKANLAAAQAKRDRKAAKFAKAV